MTEQSIKNLPNEMNEQDEKSIIEVTESEGAANIETKRAWLPSGIVSFADYDAMQTSQEAAIKVKNDASLFKGMVDNILELEPMEGMDKAQMIADLANEFTARVSSPETKELSDMALKELHYKEVMEDETKANDGDFQGSCSHCGFGDNLMKSLDKCPYCWNEV